MALKTYLLYIGLPIFSIDFTLTPLCLKLVFSKRIASCYKKNTEISQIMDSGNVISTLLLANEPDYILFKVAIDFAKQGLNVWFISIAPFEKIPENVQQPSKETLQLITFIYLKGCQDLIKHLNGIYKWHHQPDLIIVKDLETYSSSTDHGYSSLQAGLISVTLLDNIAFLARKKNCKMFALVCSTNLDDQGGLYERLKGLYDMYYDNFCVKNRFESEENLISKIEKLFLLNNTTDNGIK